MSSAADNAKASARPLARFLHDYSIETLPRDHSAVKAITENLKPGTRVYIAQVPNETRDGVVAQATELARAGFMTIPHVVARGMQDEAELDRYLGAIRRETGTVRALVLGGDVDKPVGPFTCALDLLKTGLFKKHGFETVGIATYPQPHPKFDEATAWKHLHEKLAVAKEQGLVPWLASQFCFDIEDIVGHAKRLRSEGITAPFHVGVAGPASRKTLMRFALICGVRNSVRALGNMKDNIGQLMGRYEPVELLNEIAQACAADPTLGIAGAHFFVFGGIKETADYIRKILAEEPAV